MRTLAESVTLINTYLPEIKVNNMEEEFANLLANAVVGTIVQMGSGLYPFKGDQGTQIFLRAQEQARYWDSMDKPRETHKIDEITGSVESVHTNHHKNINPNSRIYQAIQIYKESLDKTKNNIVKKFVEELGLPHQSAMTYYHLAKSERY